ncbi:MAG: type III secretion system outer membrane ring subunit SctC [Gammaproteobacteria bacterium]
MIGQSVQRRFLERRMFRLVVTVLATCCLSAVVAQTEQTEQTDWRDNEFGYVARGQTLRALLYEFVDSVGVPTVISTKINAMAGGSFPQVKSKVFLAHLVKDFGLMWIYDGTTLHIYDRSEIEEKSIDLPYTLVQKFRQGMDERKFEGAPLSWNVFPAQNRVKVTGPPVFVEEVSELVENIIQQAPDVDAGYTVRIFRIDYGYVDKDINNASGSKTNVVSLAAMLGQIMNVHHGTASDIKVAQTTDRKLRGSGLIPEQQQDEKEDKTTVAVGPRDKPRDSEAYIIADPRINAIIVRDIESRMKTYEQLIQGLDVPLDQVEIQVTILDVNNNDVENLGLQWTVSGNDSDVAISFNSTVLSTADAWQIFARVSALQETGASRIVSRPSVLTQDNHEALFQSDQTFYVRLGTERSDAVDLVPVSYGTVLKVRPHVIYEGETRKIYLSIHVEDGVRGNVEENVTDVPEVSRTVIETQATVQERQSLIIGGYNIRERTETLRQIPILGKIPIMGQLFTWKRREERQFDRYYLITPTVVDTSIDHSINTGFDDLDRVRDELATPPTQQEIPPVSNNTESELQL